MSRIDPDFSPAYFSRPYPPFMTVSTFIQADAYLMRTPKNLEGGALLSRSNGKIDLIGDVHGCFDELAALLVRMGWTLADGGHDGPIIVSHPDPERRLVLLGDLVARGPDSLSCLRLSWGLAKSGRGLTMLGNNDWQLLALIQTGLFAAAADGRMDDAISGVTNSPARAAILDHLNCMPDRVFFQHPDFGAVELVHAAPDDQAALTGRTDLPGRAFTRLYGCSVFENDTVRNVDWRPYHADDRWTIFGHQPFPAPEQVRRTIGLDLGQGLGGSLACLRLDEADPANPLSRVVVTGPGLPLRL